MKYLLFLLFFSICRQGYSQLPDYYVHLVSGDATISKAGVKPIAIKVNQLVYKGDVLVLKKGTELTLVDKDASFFVLNTAGTYKGSELIKKAAKKKNNGKNDDLTVEFFKLAFHELFDPNHDFQTFKKKNIAGAIGGGLRSDGCGNRIFPVNGLKTSAGSIVFRWHKTSPSSNYLFAIYNGDGKELTNMKVKDTLQPVNITETLQGKAGKYFWRVTSEDGGAECEDEIPIYFEILTIENEKDQAEKLITGMENASLETQLQQIDKLEKNAFINAASSRYAALVKANAGNRALRKSYVLFLLKYGFEEDARSAWK